jgi:hypothetical protein
LFWMNFIESQLGLSNEYIKEMETRNDTSFSVADHRCCFQSWWTDKTWNLFPPKLERFWSILDTIRDWLARNTEHKNDKEILPKIFDKEKYSQLSQANKWNDWNTPEISKEIISMNSQNF